ncbi:hypothetical protein DITRI_Ditri16bG0115500 [Diplodiscus trichospermus]
MFEILTRLPVKSLKRFQCVQKSWQDLIRSPVFTSVHSTSSKTKACPLLKYDNDVTGKTSISLLSNETFDVSFNLDIPSFFGRNAPYIHIQGCINGIICLWSDNDIVIWNPATEQFKVISNLRVDNLAPEPYGCFCILSRSKHFWDAVGFGHDSKTNDYKVVRIGSCCCEYCFLPNIAVDVYSSSTNSWRNLPEILPSSMIFQGRCPGFQVYLDGYYHWWAKSKGKEILLSFDMTNEIFIKTPFPETCFGNFYSTSKITQFMVMNGYVARVFCSNHEDIYKRFDVWVLGKVGVKESWKRLITIGPFFGVQRPLAADNNGGFYFENEEKKVVCYNSSTQEMKTVEIQGESLQVEIYAESLYSLGN